MPEEADIVILDPDAVRVARLSRRAFEDDTQRLVFTFESEYEGEPVKVKIGLEPEPALAMLMGLLDGLGFPEGDIEYVANRFRQEFA